MSVLTFACNGSAIALWGASKGRGVMENLTDLQAELVQVQNRMENDLQNGLGWATEDVHEAGELMSRIAKIRRESDGSM